MSNCCIKPIKEEIINKEIKPCIYYNKEGDVIPKAEWEKIQLKENEQYKAKILDSDNVNHPEHYISNEIEVIDIIEAFNLNFHLGNAVKYILRAGKKHDNVKEDIKKAIWYLNRFIKQSYGN